MNLNLTSLLIGLLKNIKASQPSNLPQITRSNRHFKVKHQAPIPPILHYLILQLYQIGELKTLLLLLKIKVHAALVTLLHQLTPLRDYTKSKRGDWLTSQRSSSSIVHQTASMEITDAMEATWSIALTTINLTKPNLRQHTLTLRLSKHATITKLLVW